MIRRLLGAAGQPSIRLRLTLWYGVLFLLAGAVLLAVSAMLLEKQET